MSSEATLNSIITLSQYAVALTLFMMIVISLVCHCLDVIACASGSTSDCYKNLDTAIAKGFIQEIFEAPI